MRLYGDLAQYWELVTPLEDHAETAALLTGLLRSIVHPLNRILELGSGSGAIAHHLPSSVHATLVDQSEDMLALSRHRNPRHRHLCANLLELELNEHFDAVLMYDAVMYLADEDALRTALRVARSHCRDGGAILFVPDILREDFQSGSTLVGGSDLDETGARLTEWHWDPDPTDDHFTVEFSLMYRNGGPVECVHESHEMTFFSRERWHQILAESGLNPVAVDLAPGFPIGRPFLCTVGQEHG